MAIGVGLSACVLVVVRRRFRQRADRARGVWAGGPAPGRHPPRIVDRAQGLVSAFRFRITPPQVIEPLFHAPGACARLDARLHQLPEVPQHRLQRLPGGGGRIGHETLIGQDGQCQTGVGDDAAAQHQVGAARDFDAAARIGHGPDLAIGDHRDAHAGLHIGDALPIGGGAVAVGLGTGVHDQLVGPGFGNRAGAVFGLRIVVKAQAHLGGHGHVGGHGTAHFAHDAVHQVRLLQQRGTAAVAIHHLGRAAEIQVDAGRAQGGKKGRVVGQADRVGAQQLRAHRHTCRRAAALAQLGDDAHIGPLGQYGIGHADELGDAAAQPAHPGQGITQCEIEQALHGREQQGHAEFYLA